MRTWEHWWITRSGDSFAIRHGIQPARHELVAGPFGSHELAEHWLADLLEGRRNARIKRASADRVAPTALTSQARAERSSDA